MATGRFISREFFTSGDLEDLPAPARLIFAGMIVYADDAGVIRDQPALFARLFCNGLAIRPHRVRTWLDSLAARGCIRREILEGVTCWNITNFARFQRLKRRQGKRRQDKDDAQSDGIAPSCPLIAPPVPPHPPDVPEELRGLSLYESDPKLCAAWPGLRDAMAKACPGVDLAHEVAKAHAWETANPTKRKTPKGRPRFLQAWMERAQNGARVGGNRETGGTDRVSSFHEKGKFDDARFK